MKVDFKPKPLVLSERKAAHVERLDSGTGSWYVDFGRAAFGRIRFRATSLKDGAVVTIHLGEVIASTGRSVERAPGGSRRYRKIEQRLKQGTHWYETQIEPDERNTGPAAILMPASVGEVLPFRYCELENYPGELSVSDIYQVWVHYPFDCSASHFRCSDPVLNDIWEFCKYSIQATSFTGVYVDGDRERIPYEGDAYINQIAHYCLDSEYAMARETMSYLMQHPTWPLEWHQHIPLIVWEEILYTGDTSFLIENYAAIREKLLLPMAREDGLLVADERIHSVPVLAATKTDDRIRPLVDWPECERDGHEIGEVDSVVNAFHYHGLVLMDRMARLIGHDQDAGFFAKRLACVRDSFRRQFFDQARGCYLDGEGTSHASLHSSMFALAFGLVPQNEKSRVLAYIRSKGMACSVYGSQYLLDGLYRAGADCHALELLTSQGERSWAHMLYDVGSTITMEAWDDRFKPNQDWNHAWGAAPANIIPRRLMGIMPTQPGFRHVRIHPMIAGLEYAEIKHPTPFGPIQMSVVQSESKLQIEGFLPDGVDGEFCFPNGGRALLKAGQRFSFDQSLS